MKTENIGNGKIQMWFYFKDRTYSDECHFTTNPSEDRIRTTDYTEFEKQMLKKYHDYHLNGRTKVDLYLIGALIPEEESERLSKEKKALEKKLSQN